MVDVLAPMLLSLAPCSGWLAAVGFFQTNVGAAVVMLLPAIMFSMSAAMMAIAIIKVSPLGPGLPASYGASGCRIARALGAHILLVPGRVLMFMTS